MSCISVFLGFLSLLPFYQDISGNAVSARHAVTAITCAKTAAAAKAAVDIAAIAAKAAKAAVARIAIAITIQAVTTHAVCASSSSVDGATARAHVAPLGAAGARIAAGAANTSKVYTLKLDIARAARAAGATRAGSTSASATTTAATSTTFTNCYYKNSYSYGRDRNFTSTIFGTAPPPPPPPPNDLI